MLKGEKLPRRFGAYMIDMLVFVLVIFLCNALIQDSPKVATLNLQMNAIHELALDHQISIHSYFSEYANLTHALDKEKVMISVINCMFIMIYFVFIPYFFEGKTLGKKLMGLKIVRKDGELLMLNDLLIRNLIINGLGFMLLSLSILYLAPSMIYFLISTFLGIFQIILVIASAFMIIYRKDKRGVHDIFSDTLVVRDK